MGIKALLYFEIVTTLALFYWAGRNVFPMPAWDSRRHPTGHSYRFPPPPQKWTDVVCTFFRKTLPKSVAEGQVLQVSSIQHYFGIALALIGEEKRRPMLAFCEKPFSDDVQVHTSSCCSRPSAWPAPWRIP